MNLIDCVKKLSVVYLFSVSFLHLRYIAELAKNNKLCIPVPSFNMISGGRYADNKLSCQEFQILPIGACMRTCKVEYT